MNLPNTSKKDLDDYLKKVTTKESPVLQSLRQESQTSSPLPQMLCGPVEGQLIAMLIKLSGAKRCLEIGTFTGYSALYIASALPVDGKLITCEINEEHANMAQRYFDRSPDGHKIELRLGDAIQTIPTLDEPFDFIFIDANKASYPVYYDLLIPKLKPKGLMIVDNALWRNEVVHPVSNRALAIDSLNQKASHDPQVETVMLSVEDGMLLIRKRD